MEAWRKNSAFPSASPACDDAVGVRKPILGQRHFTQAVGIQSGPEWFGQGWVVWSARPEIAPKTGRWTAAKALSRMFGLARDLWK